jgi:hypothetical protein
VLNFEFFLSIEVGDNDMPLSIQSIPEEPNETELPRQLPNLGPNITKKILEYMPDWQGVLPYINRDCYKINKERSYEILERISCPIMIGNQQVNSLAPLNIAFFPDLFVVRPYHLSHIQHMDFCLTSALKAIPGGSDKFFKVIPEGSNSSKRIEEKYQGQNKAFSIQRMVDLAEKVQELMIEFERRGHITSHRHERRKKLDEICQLFNVNSFEELSNRFMNLSVI